MSVFFCFWFIFFIFFIFYFHLLFLYSLSLTSLSHFFPYYSVVSLSPSLHPFFPLLSHSYFPPIHSFPLPPPPSPLSPSYPYYFPPSSHSPPICPPFAPHLPQIRTSQGFSSWRDRRYTHSFLRGITIKTTENHDWEGEGRSGGRQERGAGSGEEKQPDE